MVVRVGGLISGLDTDSLIKALTMAQQSKIDKLKQQNTTGTWQQAEYRTIISKMNSFQSKYFSASNPLTNLFSAASITQYNSSITNSAGASSSAVSVMATGSVKNTAHTLEVHSLAQKETWQSGTPVKMEGQALDAAALSKLNDAITDAGSSGISFAASFDGQTKAIKLTGSYNSADELAADLQTKLTEAFGSGKVTVTASNGQLNFSTVESGHSFGIGDIKGGAETVNLLGFDDLSFTTLDVNKTLDKIGASMGLTAGANGKIEFSINGANFSFDPETTTMQDVFNKVNESNAGVRMYYSEINNAVIMEAKNTGVSNGISFSDGEGDLMTSLFGAGSGGKKTQEAADAKFTLDGVTTTRSSNTFESDGITYTLNQVTDTKENDGSIKSNPLNINLTQDTSKAKSLITEFVKDYNELIEYINGKTREEKVSGYDPLTDEQKAALTEYEIKEWETQAKTGLLRNDPLLRNALSGLSNSVFLSKGESGVTAYALGIMQSGSYSDGGQIKLDMDQLEKALLQNPAAVESFFTDAANGLAKNMNDVLTAVASTDIANQGTLVKKAGVAGKSSEYFNDISAAARNRNTQIATLLESLTKKQNDLYARYAKMESTMNTMQQQLSSLTSAFG